MEIRVVVKGVRFAGAGSPIWPLGAIPVRHGV